MKCYGMFWNAFLLLKLCLIWQGYNPWQVVWRLSRLQVIHPARQAQQSPLTVGTELKDV